MRKEEYLEIALELLISVISIIAILEMTDDIRWKVFKHSLVKKWQSFWYRLSPDYQRQIDIKQIAKAMGYEPEWIDRLFL
jgi:hypothetical protein